MLSDAEMKLLGYASIMRAQEQEKELWWCPADDYFTEAARLWTTGWLDRKWHGDDLTYRLSDRGVQAKLMGDAILRDHAQMN